MVADATDALVVTPEMDNPEEISRGKDKELSSLASFFTNLFYDQNITNSSDSETNRMSPGLPEDGF